MKTRNELKAAILQRERIAIDEWSDDERDREWSCPWCGETAPMNDEDISDKIEHRMSCLWRELKYETGFSCEDCGTSLDSVDAPHGTCCPCAAKRMLPRELVS